jgi:glutaredoxin
MFLLYTKSNCPDCITAKKLLHKEETIIINCDDLLENDRETFIKEMRKKIKKDRITFPIVFLDDMYLGGIIDLFNHLVFNLDEDF